MAPAIVVDDVAKRFRLVHERNHTLKATILRRGRTRYEEFWAVDGVSFEVDTGTTFGLIGHNGSGKSTLLKCIAGILRPDRGSIATVGKTSALLELGAGFHPELSGRENVFLNGSILGMSARQMRERFDDIVEFAGLERFIDQPVKNYSSGMFVRLGFSVAINVEPDILLVDEVMAVGDEQFQHRCAEKFGDLRREGRTIVVVSHGLGTLRNQCDTIAWMERGRLRQVGPAGEVVDAYIAEVRASEVDPGAAPSPVTAEGIDLRLFDDAGQEARVLRSGAGATIRVRVAADRLDEPVEAAIDVHRPDGVHLASSSTTLTPGEAPLGVAEADYRIDHLPLLAGVYDLSLVITGRRSAKELARADRALRFEVRPGERVDGEGLVALGGDWGQRTGAERS